MKRTIRTVHTLRTVLVGLLAAAMLTTGVAAAQPVSPAASPTTAAAPRSAQPAPAGASVTPDAAGPAFSETTFVPILPCRAIDTRPDRIAAGTTENFVIRGTAGFEAQGGRSGGCGVPAAATGVAVSVSSVNIGGVGYFRIWPYGQADPGATITHYQPGAITTTGGTLTLGAAGQSADVTAKAFSAGAGLVVDITGYYVTPIQAEVKPDGTLYAGTPRVLSSSRSGTGSYVVTIDRSVDGCAPTVTVAGGHYFASGYVTGNTVQVQTWQISGGVVSLADVYWYLTVTC